MAAEISLCMIVKNEEDTLGRCLSGVRPYVEEIVVVPTHIHHLSALALHHFHQYLEETRVVWLPLPHPAFFEVPSVDNVAVKYQAATVHVA